MIIFDTETTGLPEPKSAPLCNQPHIIEFGAIKVDDDFNEIDRMNVLIDPLIELPEIITKITGITPEDLKGKPVFGDVVGDISAFFLGEVSMVAHNLPFDRQLLCFELKRLRMVNRFPWPSNHLCTIELTKHRYQKWPKLEQLWREATGEEPQQTHRAIEDCEMLLTVCKYLRTEGLM